MSEFTGMARISARVVTVKFVQGTQPCQNGLSLSPEQFIPAHKNAGAVTFYGNHSWFRLEKAKTRSHAGISQDACSNHDPDYGV
jgi:hypothetical protein